MRLLSVDWDYFFPTYHLDPKLWALYDWGMKDSAFYREALWPTRGAAFLMNQLPLPDTTGLENSFWSRFKFAPDAKLYYGDSHLYAALIPECWAIDQVWNFDAHHDLGYSGTQRSIVAEQLVSCDNWLGWYKHSGAKVRVIYPRWKPDAKTEEAKPVFGGERRIDNDEPVSVPFHAIYVCRSSAWTPPWLDEKFVTFMEVCPVSNPVNLQKDYDALTPREFSMDEVNQHVAAWKLLMKEEVEQ